MEQIALGTSGHHTTRLGFGCASLMGATEPPQTHCASSSPPTTPASATST